MFELTVEETFSAAHQIKNYDGPCEKLHGHTWKVRAAVEGKKLNELGMVEDFRELKKILRDVVKRFDHTSINDLSDFKKVNPTAENIAVSIYKSLEKKVPSSVKLKKVTVWESPTTSASYFEESKNA